jgi:hypothetical protein
MIWTRYASSKKSSVKRHIQNIHNANANSVSLVDSGQEGRYLLASSSPTYQNKNNEKIDYTGIMTDQVWRQLIRRKMGGYAVFISVFLLIYL